MPTPIELAYIAGFVDGEGCLHISKYLRKDRHTKSPTYCVVGTVTNTSLDVIKWLQSIYGGHIQKVTQDRRKDSFTIHLGPNATYKLLDGIYPYLKVKRAQADNLLRLKELRRLYPHPRKLPGVNGSLPSSQEYLDLQDECYRRNRQLNQRGSLNYGNLSI